MIDPAEIRESQWALDESAIITAPDYGKELFLRFVEDIAKRLSDEEWERVRKVRAEPRLEAAQEDSSEAEEGKP